MNTTAFLIIELNATVTGNYIPYVPAIGPSYSSGGEPAEGDYCEDIAIDGLTISVSEAPLNGPHQPDRRWRQVDILAGIDTSNPEIQKLLANILACIEEEAQNELTSAAADTDDREYEPEPDDRPQWDWDD